MVLVKKWPFFQLFFLGNAGLEIVFYDILERKNVFLGFKNKKSKKSKNWHLPMVLVQKWPFLQLFFLSQYRPGKCLLWYSRTKKHLSIGYKNKKSKKSKNWLFSKGVNPWFSSKNSNFSNFFFRQYTPGKGLLWYSKTKKHRSRL